MSAPTPSQSIGIDCGSSFIKAVLFASGQVKKSIVTPSGWDIAATGSQLISDLLGSDTASRQDTPIVATGYGREQIADSKKITEITCHARGAHYLFPDIPFVIDIGGQDYKVMKVSQGKVLSFQMNDRCAAGTGRFLEMVLNRLQLDYERMEELLSMNQTVSINSTCVVFAESEIIGLLAKGVCREKILGGVVESMVNKIAGQAARIGITSHLALTGGLAASQGIRQFLSKSLGQTVEAVPGGNFAGAIGAAILALEN
jgi:predicted CoA-substrate-specific enzyme activase